MSKAQPRASFTTKGGTVLPLLNLKGKEYLQVAHRIQWFKEETGTTGSIKTQMIEKNGSGKDAYCVFRAEVFLSTDKGTMLVATAHKMETASGFPDYIEKSETGAIGRALALCGYGTQFSADELDEGDRLADSPTPVVEKASVSASSAVAEVSAVSKRTTFRKNVTATAANDDI